MIKGTCAKCGIEFERHGQRYCLTCHNAYMREWRKTHRLNGEQRKKDTARSYAGVYLRRGKIEKKACEICESENSQMHHPDYSKPLEVQWLCRQCHMELHDLEMSNVKQVNADG